MNFKKLLLGLFIMGTVATTFTSCRSEGEKVADDIEDAADDVGDALD